MTGIAVVGVGAHAVRTAIPALKQTPGLRLVGLYSRTPAKVRAQAEEFGCRAYSTAEELLGDPEVEVLYLGLPTGLHAEWCRRGLEGGKHIWCEKPLTSCLADSLALIELAKERGLSLEEGIHVLTPPSAGKGEVAAGRRVVGQDSFHPGAFRLSSSSARQRSLPSRDGGWGLPRCRLLSGRMVTDLCSEKPERVMGRLHAQSGYTVDTDGAAYLEYSDKVAFLEWGLGRAYRNELEIWGESGLLRASRAFSKPATHRPEIEIRRSDGSTEQIEIEERTTS